MQDAAYKTLPLANSSVQAMVSAEDHARLARWTWWLHSEGYAYRNEGDYRVYLHRDVLGLARNDGLQADHVNRDRLDNRRENLRIATNAQNCQNRPSHTGFRGVYFEQRRGKWMARVKLDYRHRFLGRYDNERDAALAAEAFRREHLPFAEPDPALNDAGECPCRDCREPRPARRAA